MKPTTSHPVCRSLALTLALLGGAPVAAEAAAERSGGEGIVKTRMSEDEAALRRAGRREETLRRLSRHLAEGDGSGAAGAVPLLLDIAVSPAATPGERRRAADLLRWIAARGDRVDGPRAERALETVRQSTARGQRAPAPRSLDPERSREEMQRKLDALMARIGDPRQPDRGRLAATLTLLASSAPPGDFGLPAFAYWMRRDSDPEVIRWGETLVARFEGRPPDPALAPPVTPTEAVKRRDRERRERVLEMATDSDPRHRHDALRTLFELLSVTDSSDARDELLEALRRATGDPDPRVAALARFTLEGLTGDRRALGMVYVAEPGS